ncbi:MAG: hypothetical protein DMG72_09815 [Acidobacteria bacterium]|nr:MAG: hypothetical protein DMG72_09815 [Acidobacteriota bacterium]
MAFCNSCGATLDPSARFCPKCGASVPSVAGTPASPAAATPARSSTGLKIILIIVAIVVGLGILGMVASAFFAWQIARSTHVSSSGDKVRVETPFGTVETAKNADEAARNLGIDVYPGAKALKSNAATVTVGGMKTVGAEFETSDPPEKVVEFYKEKFPHATMSITDDKHYALVSTDKKGMVTINVEPQEGRTRIHIAYISGKPPAETQ